MLYIAIIGCGQIGSRHLQSLVHLNESATIYLVDPSPESIDKAKSIFNDSLKPGGSTQFEIKETALSELYRNLDVVIIATSSAIRKKILFDVYEYCQPRHIILEKFLFQRSEDYDAADTLIKSHATKVWVNQWLTSSYAFNRVSGMFKGAHSLNMHVYGNDWGMGCNSVHFIDFFDLLTGYQDLEVSKVELDDGYLESKRDGYVEFSGKISIGTTNKSVLILDATLNGGDRKETQIDISDTDSTCKMMLFADRLECEIDSHDSGSSVETYRILFQSEVTHTLIHDLVASDSCSLPDYERSFYHHRLVLPVFIKHLQDKCDWSGDHCPIT